MRRTDGNFAAWADFKAWMDVAFADAAAPRHRCGASPPTRTPSRAIEGAQMPGWGGYDYTQLAHAVDVMEIYDTGENLPILRSLNPRADPARPRRSAAPTPRTCTGSGANCCAARAAWSCGTRTDSIVRPDGALGERGEAYAPLFAELHRIAPLLFAATPQIDPIAILYSPASFRTQWMLDQQPKGDAWIERGAEQED